MGEAILIVTVIGEMLIPTIAICSEPASKSVVELITTTHLVTSLPESTPEGQVARTNPREAP